MAPGTSSLPWALTPGGSPPKSHLDDFFRGGTAVVHRKLPKDTVCIAREDGCACRCVYR